MKFDNFVQAIKTHILHPKKDAPPLEHKITTQSGSIKVFKGSHYLRYLIGRELKKIFVKNGCWYELDIEYKIKVNASRKSQKKDKQWSSLFIKAHRDLGKKWNKEDAALASVTTSDQGRTFLESLEQGQGQRESAYIVYYWLHTFNEDPEGKEYPYKKHAYEIDEEFFGRKLDKEFGQKRTGNPYKGLRAFGENDSDIFFGRDEEIDELVERVTNHRFTAVLGASGSGKSSLVAAGLIPKLVNDYDYMAISLRLTQSAKHNPFDALADAISQILTGEVQKTISKNLQERVMDVADYANKLVRKVGKTRVLIFIDQFEELAQFDDKSVKQFIALLHEAYLSTDKPNSEHDVLKILITLRWDFIGYFKLTKAFNDLVLDNKFSVEGITDEKKLKCIITDPLHNSSPTVSFVNKLEDEICRDAAKLSQCLPLLQFTLSELWERRDGTQITFEAYIDIGGVTGALAKQADEIIKRLPERGENTQDIEEHAKWLFIQLLHTSKDSPTSKKRIQLSQIKPEKCQEIAQRLAGSFTDAQQYQTPRLIVIEYEENKPKTVEITHEVLIEKWTLLKTWIEDGKEYTYWNAKFQLLLSDWLKLPDDTSLYLSGSRLSEASEMLRKYHYILEGSNEQKYINLCLKHQALLDKCEERAIKNKQRKKERQSKKLLEDQKRKAKKAVRNKTITLSFVFILFITVTSFLLIESINNQAQSILKRKQDLASLSELYLKSGNIRLSILTALESIKLNSSPNSHDENSYLKALNSLKATRNHYVNILDIPYEGIGNTRAFDISSDLEKIVLVQEKRDSSEIIVWDLQNSSEIMRIPDSMSSINKVTLGQSEDYFSFTSHHEASGEVWDISDKKKILSLNEKDIKRLFLSTDKNYYLTEEHNGRFSIGYIPDERTDGVDIINVDNGETLSLNSSGCCFYHTGEGFIKKYKLNGTEYSQQGDSFTDLRQSSYVISPDQSNIISRGNDNKIRMAKLEDYLNGGDLKELKISENKKVNIENLIFNKSGDFFAFIEYSETGDYAHIFHKNFYLGAFSWGNQDIVDKSLSISKTTWDYIAEKSDYPSWIEHKTGIFNLLSSEQSENANFEEFYGGSGRSKQTRKSRYLSQGGKKSIEVFKKINLPSDFTYLPGKYSFAGWDSYTGNIYADAHTHKVTKNHRYNKRFFWDFKRANLEDIFTSRIGMYDDFDLNDFFGDAAYCDHIKIADADLELELKGYICGHIEGEIFELNEISSKDKEVYLSDKVSGKRIKIGGYIPISTLKGSIISKSKRYFAFVSEQDLVVTDLTMKLPVKKISLDGENYKLAGAFLKNDDYLLLYDNVNLLIVNLENGQVKSEILSEMREISNVKFIDNINSLLWVEDGKHIFLKNIFTQELGFSYHIGGNIVNNVELSPDFNNLLWVESDGTTIIAPVKIYSNDVIVDEFEELNIPEFTKEEREQLGLD